MFKLLMIVTLISNGWVTVMERRAEDGNGIMTFPTREACETQAKIDEPNAVEIFKQQYGVTRGKEIELDFTCEPIGKPA